MHRAGLLLCGAFLLVVAPRGTQSAADTEPIIATDRPATAGFADTPR
jgi:hypothetical protein